MAPSATAAANAPRRSVAAAADRDDAGPARLERAWGPLLGPLARRARDAEHDSDVRRFRCPVGQAR